MAEQNIVNIEQSIASNNTPNISGSGRKRGHQHHVRNTGTRTSNIKADEIIAALRRGDQLPIAQTVHQYCEHEPSLQHSDIDLDLPDDSAHCSTTTDQNRNRNTNSINRTLIEDFNGNNRLESKDVALTDLTTGQPSKVSVISRDSGDLTETTTVNTKTSVRALSSDTEMEAKVKTELKESVSSGSNSNSKSKSKRSKKGQETTLDSEHGAKKEKRSKKVKNLPPTEERPPLEGADADQWTDNADVENDPEVAEWSKLRCTSERAEVVAEREYRRQNRRCADYPGFAFGRSIFSSDTMMKLNIIRNELHNIMKTQLKRVRVTSSADNIHPKCSYTSMWFATHILFWSSFFTNLKSI